MTQKNTNYTLYILAFIIILTSARLVQVRIRNHMAAQQLYQQVAISESRHQLITIINNAYFANTNFMAAVQVNNIYGEWMQASINATLLHNGNEIMHTVPFYTNQYGHSTIEFPLHNLASGEYTLRMAVESDMGEEFFYNTFHIQEDRAQNFVINFDKGLYNPGDDVLFRILALYSSTAEPIARGQFNISIFDGNSNRVYSQTAQASEFGIISGRFSLADEVNSGFYRLQVSHGNAVVAEAVFEVSPFVLPRFEVNLSTDKAEYQLGEAILLTGNAMYFFGEPVNQGNVAIHINNQTFNTELDDYGNFSFTHIAETPGAYEFWVEVIDNSNYRIEATLTVHASEGIFQIEVMPELGYLVQGMPNTVYIFTHRASGAPVRTFMQVTGRNFSRQVATDENGIGMFILEDAELENHILVIAQDMEGNRIQQDFYVAGVARNITLRTNKPRYAMGGTVYLELNSTDSNGMFKIYAYRNNRLLQIVQTTDNTAKLNFDGAFGLIDIYAIWVPTGTTNTRTLPHAHRTIFVDPGRYMQLNIQSDRPEYKPGEFVNLSIDVTDNTGTGLEAALLVSIVDEAMLSLAANDLSIDNIRLALEDIRFGNDLDAATLYTSLIAGVSEQALTRLLLRQDSSRPDIRLATLVNPEYTPANMSWQRAWQSFLNALRVILLMILSVCFFISYRAKHKTLIQPIDHASSTDTMPILSNKRVVLLVAISLFVALFSLIFLSSCSSNRDDSESDSVRQDNVAFDQAAPAPSIPRQDSDFSASFEMAADAPPSVAGIHAGHQPIQPTDSPPVIETQTARVRRLFLETMLFVPELIARDGHADLAFILADNITTWNIQVVGNTKDGIVGYSQSSIRAFQPFFVDFELPRNSIRHDQVSIPVTVFNYTEEDQTVIITIAEMDWFLLHGDAVQTITVPHGRSQMVYIPITITQFGNYVFRVYADTFNFADAAERPISINPEGFRIREVVSSGSINSSTWQHLLFMQEDIADTRRAFITFYPSAMSQVIEGMENIFRMPFGCFEQTSSILYPNILALQYMRQNNLDSPELTQRALTYINSGYQRLLTFEVGGRTGGFSLFGSHPAETLLTAYGLMQLKDLYNVYTIDGNVLYRMLEFLFEHQNWDGSFEITGRDVNRICDSQSLAFNAYITWALSEAFPTDPRLANSISYLLFNLYAIDDNYTLALLANALVNVGDAMASYVVDRLVNNIVLGDNTAHVTSSTRDYFGAFGSIQYLQATALTSLALSRYGSHDSVNDLLINYIISRRDTWGTWHSTQATILSLKALTSHTAQAPLEDGQITVTIGDQERVITIDSQNTLDLYQVSFTELERENIVDIRFPDLGRVTYKIVVEYFAPYDSVELNRGFELSSRMNTELAVHELVQQEIRIVNTSGDIVNNGLVAISIPQGFRVERNSLAMLQHMGIIERYEMRFDNINLYMRDTDPGEIIDLTIAYRPAFPVAVTGGHVRVFDYYNPMVEGFLKPVEIVVR